MKNKDISKETICVHSGTYFDEITQGVNSPVFTSSSFGYMTTAEIQYPRNYNTPNQKVIVEKLCALENGEDGLVFSSGMAAICTVLLTLLKKGDHAIFQNDLYGGTHHFITTQLDRFEIEYTLIEDNDISSFENVIKPNTKIIYIETPSNPLLKIIDIKAIARLAESKGLVSVIDNTFATPINQNPLNFGIDVVIHSGTKYLGGHSDICFGAVVTSADITKEIHKSAVNFGGSLNAATCSLIERSMKTLSLRVSKQNENALSIAKSLLEHPGIDKVWYPGLESHDGYETAKKQMTGFGGILSFELRAGGVCSESFLQNLKLIKPACSLGGVETIICSPAQTSHAKLTSQERQKTGISDGLLRLSVGIEDANDLIGDIQQAAGG